MGLGSQSAVAEKMRETVLTQSANEGQPLRLGFDKNDEGRGLGSSDETVWITMESSGLADGRSVNHPLQLQWELKIQDPMSQRQLEEHWRDAIRNLEEAKRKVAARFNATRRPHTFRVADKQLKQQRDKIKQYQKRIENNLEKDRQLARTLLQNGRKERAKLLLRKKKFQEQLLQKTDGQLENLERLVHDLEFSQIEMQVIDGLKVGNEALKKIHEVLNIDEVEKILDETREGVEKQREIDDLLTGALTAEDEDEVEEELERIIQAEMPEMPEVPKEELAAGEPLLPDVPAESVPEKAREHRRKEKQALEAA